jgi:hypothetical protein
VIATWKEIYQSPAAQLYEAVFAQQKYSQINPRIIIHIFHHSVSGRKSTPYAIGRAT